jgi:hypothetical protein
VAAQNAERQVHVGIIAAADLAAMLNELPHLRSAFIATGAFRSWAESWEAHQRVIAFPQISLTGRDRTWQHSVLGSTTLRCALSPSREEQPTR